MKFTFLASPLPSAFRSFRLLRVALAGLLVAALAASSEGKIIVRHQGQEGDFSLVVAGQASALCVDKQDYAVVHHAAECFAQDVERVSGVKPQLQDRTGSPGRNVVLIGTLGKSALIDTLVRSNKLDVRGLAGKWEAFLVTVVSDPLPGVSHGLVIVGSDRRGTAYGVFSVSEAIGVSPWVWWADVAPDKQDALFLGRDATLSPPPSVKYRGIFINDEDWGLHPWAGKTFEPETGDIGPKTYAKVFELLLRLKANLLWPAMHECTKAFDSIPRNKEVADEWGIVMGSSHAEPMLFNNASEWKLPKTSWNYDTNSADIKAVWEKRVRENGRYENSYTVGLRGIHDSGMQGGGTVEQGVSRLQRAIADQRDLLARYVNPQVDRIPQVFVPYKEVLTYYQHGLKVPDDVTLVWVDDNHGYIRQLSNPEELKRSGGGGVYYHHSYWGDPEDYLWLNTTSLALTWEEMSKAYDHGARTLWVLNVGDIKPMEIGMEFFLRMAWDITPWDENAQLTYLTDWAGRNFGPEFAADTAAIMDEYYRLNYPVKPEHLLRVRFPAGSGEAEARIQRFLALVEKATALQERIPASKKDSFFETVLYPVTGAADLNRKWLTSDPAEAAAAYADIERITGIFNGPVAGGKWKEMMSFAPRDRKVFQKRDFDAEPVPDPQEREQAAARSLSVAFEAETPTRSTGLAGASWKVIKGLGRSGDSIALLPTTVLETASASLEYDFTVTRSGPAQVRVYCIPTHAIYPSLGLRCSASIDHGPAQVMDLETKEYSAQWSWNTVNNTAVGRTRHDLSEGKHTLTIRPLSPGIVFDKIVVDLGDAPPTMLGLPTTP